nr:ribonuclease H-like domain-containing protein [Tanacetum cinerariifolium]
MALISSTKDSSRKGEINTASIPTASTHVSPTSADVAAASISHDTIDEDDIEESDIKWNMALLSMRADRFWKKTGKKITIQGTDVAGFDKSKVECFNCHKMGHFARSVGHPGAKNGVKEKSTNKIKKEKEGLDSKLTGFESASKDLDTLLGCQRSDKNKEGLGYSVVPLSCSTDCAEVKTNKVETVRKSSIRYVEMYRNTSKSPKVRGNQRNWTNLKTQQSGKDFVMKNKACFKCGQFDHLAYDCGVWVNKGKTWPKNNYTHKSMSLKNIFHKTGRTPIAVNRTHMNVAQPKRTFFAKPAHSYVRRPFQRKSAVRTQFRVPRVSTVNKKFPTIGSTAKSTFSAGLGNKGKAVKASTCWIQRHKQTTFEKGPNNNSVSVIFKKYQYIDTQGRLKLVMAWVPKEN